MRLDLNKCLEHAINSLLLCLFPVFRFVSCCSAFYFMTDCYLVRSVLVRSSPFQYFLFLSSPFSQLVASPSHFSPFPFITHLFFSCIFLSHVQFSLFFSPSFFHSLPLFVKSNMSDLWSAEATGGNQLTPLLFIHSPLLPPSVHPAHLTQRLSKWSNADSPAWVSGAHHTNIKSVFLFLS